MITSWHMMIIINLLARQFRQLWWHSAVESTNIDHTAVPSYITQYKPWPGSISLIRPQGAVQAHSFILLLVFVPFIFSANLPMSIFSHKLHSMQQYRIVDKYSIWEVSIPISDMLRQIVDTYWFSKSSGAAHTSLFKISLQYGFGRNRASCSWLLHESWIILPLWSVNCRHYCKKCKNKEKRWSIMILLSGEYWVQWGCINGNNKWQCGQTLWLGS